MKSDRTTPPETAHESDLMLPYIAERAATLLSNAAADEEISHEHAVELRDMIGELIGEVERLLRELNLEVTPPDSLLVRRTAELTKAAEPMARPRATMREGQPGYLEHDIFHIEVTFGDWAKLLTALGWFGAELLPGYADIAGAEFSPEFVAELTRIEKAVEG